MSRNINDFPKIAMHSTLPYNINLDVADTYYCICDSNNTGLIVQYFTQNATTGEITYDFDMDMILRFVGDTGISVNQACNITFGLFINGIEVVDTTTGFTSSSKVGTMGVNGIFTLQKNDIIQVKAKSNTNSTILTVDSLELSIA